MAERLADRINVWREDSRPITSVVAGAVRRSNGSISMPLRLDNCRLLRAHYGKRLQVGPKLNEWARGALAQEAEQTALSGQMNTVLQRIPERYPGLYSAMASRPYQRVGARFIAEGRRVLIADEMGLGKTLQALAGVAESGVTGPYLVICPKTAIGSVWEPEIRRWLPDQLPIPLPEGRRKREEALRSFLNLPSEDAERAWIIMNPAMVRVKRLRICAKCLSETPYEKKTLKCKHSASQANTVKRWEYPQLSGVEWGGIIADESDQCLITRNVRNPSQTRFGMEQLIVKDHGLKIAQSATPTRAKPYLLWGTLNWLNKKQYSGLWNWAETYFQIEQNYMGHRDIGKIRPDREEILHQSLSGIMLRRTLADVAPELPAKIYTGPGLDDGTRGIFLPMEGHQLRAYKEMAKNASARIRDGNLNAVGALAEITRLKQLASSYGRYEEGKFIPEAPSNKLEYLRELLTQLGYPDSPHGKVVIVSQFTSLLTMVQKELGMGDQITKITGSVTGDARRSAVEAFNSSHKNSPHVMLLNINAGGAAITLDSADDMVFLDEATPDLHLQAEGRINNRRPEQKIAPRRFHYLRSAGSIDLGIARANAESSRENSRILEGLEYAKRAIDLS